MNNNQFQNIKKPWIEGSGTLYFGIPSEIVKKLKLNQYSFLLIDLVDDSIIVIKKVNPQFPVISSNNDSEIYVVVWCANNNPR